MTSHVIETMFKSLKKQIKVGLLRQQRKKGTGYFVVLWFYCEQYLQCIYLSAMPEMCCTHFGETSAALCKALLISNFLSLNFLSNSTIYAFRTCVHKHSQNRISVEYHYFFPLICDQLPLTILHPSLDPICDIHTYLKIVSSRVGPLKLYC